MLIEILELFFNRKCDVTLGDFLEFLELFFNGGKMMWHNVVWHAHLIFLNIFQCKKMA
jgi:hypothetical protein